MKDDDPVEELHRIRWRICKKAGGTPADYFRYYYEMDKKIFGESNGTEAKAVQRKPRRKAAKPVARASVRKPAQHRRKAVTT